MPVSRDRNGVASFMKYSIASVWFINGLFCKVLDLVPRHQLIVERITTFSDAGWLTKLIGAAEIAIGVAIVIDYRRKSITQFQILLVLAMNIIEQIFAPDLLLFGRWNFLFAAFFCLYLYAYLIFRKNKLHAHLC